MSFNVVFMGTPEFAVPSLEALIQGLDDLVGVVTQPDRPVGRGRRRQPSPVKKRALEVGLKVMDPTSVEDPSFIRTLRELAPDVIVVAAFGQIIPKEILGHPKFGCLNVHASLLPKYRGAAPIARAILSGESTTGVTVIRMEEQLDAGDILLARHLQIGEFETAHQLSERLSRLGAQVLMETLRGLERGTIQPVPQKEEEATYAPRLKKSDGQIHWPRAAEEIARQVRAMTPWPGAFTYWRGRSLKIHIAKALQVDESGVPGQVARADRGCLWVQTGEGCLEIQELQPESRPRMSATAFVHGHADIVGDILGR